MPHNEMRKDYFLNRWAVIATSRSRRPTDFAGKQRQQQTQSATCPMCPGNEHMTPPAMLVYLKSGKLIRREADRKTKTHKNWLVRCIPNLFPAFSPPEDEANAHRLSHGRSCAQAVGHHEVVVESPNHNEHPADAPLSQLELATNAYVDRFKELSSRPYVKYVSIFRNHGVEAGASLSHAHSQIIATPTVPRIIEEETRTSRTHHSHTGHCKMCEIIKEELDGPRKILENKDFAVFAPYASVHPMEFWIAPKKHQSTILQTSKPQMHTFSSTLKTCLASLKNLVNDPPYNYGIHQTNEKSDAKSYHWHLEVYPKLSIWAGFELSTGMYINTVTPETAAEHMRNAISP